MTMTIVILNIAPLNFSTDYRFRHKTLLTHHQFRMILLSAHLWCSPIQQTWDEQSTKVLVPGKNRHHALGKRLRIISAMNHLPYKSPHQYRHCYALYGLERCQTMEQYHALSRNMMHNNISITDQVYVHLKVQERGRILSEIYENPVMQPNSELAALILKLGKEDIQDALRLIANRLVSL